MTPETFKQHLLYWIVPGSLVLTCILIYFLDVFHLSTLIAPPHNRELGVIEHLQLFILTLIFLLALKGAKIGAPKWEKLGFKVVALVTIFILLEEIDYGLHYYDYFTSQGSQANTTIKILDVEVRNFHNSEASVLSVMKMTSYFLIVLFFVVLPLIPSKLKEKISVLDFLNPSHFIIGTAISLLILNQLTIFLYKNYNYTNHALDGNISEFEETMTYYIMFLYVREIVKKRQEFFENTVVKRTGSQ